VAGLGLVLGVQAALIGPPPGFSADELALVVQVDALGEGSWFSPHPYPEVDPERRAVPDHLAATSEQGYTSYPKHPLVPLVLRWATDLVGGAGPQVVLIAGQVAAAVAVARVVRVVAPRAAPAAFWLVGAGSPLVLHAHVLWMHGWGLALGAIATGATLGLARSGGPAGHRWRAAAVLGVSLAALVLVRTEGLLFAGAVAAALAAAAWPRRDRWLAAASVAVAMGGLAVHRAELWWIRQLVGEVAFPAWAAGDAGFWAQRGWAVALNLLHPGYHPTAAVGQVAGMALLAVAAWRLRRGGGGAGVLVPAAAGAALHVAAMYLPAPSPVPGLVPAFPLLFVPALLAGRRRRPAGEALAPGRPRGPRPAARPAGRAGEADARVLAHLALVTVGLVAATAYASGAGIDWGGRYSQLAVPALAALAALRLDELAHRVDVRRFTVVLVAATVAAAPAVTLRLAGDTRRVAQAGAAMVERASTLEPGPDTGLAVVVTPDVRLGRLLAARSDAVTGLRAGGGQHLGLLLGRLGERGAGQVLVVGVEPFDLDTPARAAGWRAGPPEAITGRVWARLLERG
jgi:hypothetical protein